MELHAEKQALLVGCLEGDWSLTEAAEAAGVRERTAAKWLVRWYDRPRDRRSARDVELDGFGGAGSDRPGQAEPPGATGAAQPL